MIKIDKIGLFQTSLFLAAMAGIGAIRSSNIQEEITNYKKQVLENDTSIYNKTLARTKNEPIQIQEYLWEEAYINSMQTKGNAERSYFEGGLKVFNNKK